MARSLEKNVGNAAGAAKGLCAMFRTRLGQRKWGGRLAGEHAWLFHGMLLTQPAVNKVITQDISYPTSNRMSDVLAMH
jgi:hypothetical protein